MLEWSNTHQQQKSKYFQNLACICRFLTNNSWSCLLLLCFCSWYGREFLCMDPQLSCVCVCTFRDAVKNYPCKKEEKHIDHNMGHRPAIFISFPVDAIFESLWGSRWLPASWFGGMKAGTTSLSTGAIFESMAVVLWAHCYIPYNEWKLPCVSQDPPSSPLQPKRC